MWEEPTGEEPMEKGLTQREEPMGERLTQGEEPVVEEPME